jgi:hypothetical protein
MTSEARRDPISDPLLTPENAALVLIDYGNSWATEIAIKQFAGKVAK